MKIAEIQALLTPARLDEIAARWGGSGANTRFIRAVENYVYDFAPAERPLILRCTHSTHRTSDQVAAELEFVDYLARHGVAVAHPVLSRHGRLIEILPAGDTYFVVAVFEKAPGAKYTFDRPGAAEDTFFQDWGAMMGAMHRVVPKYRDGRGDSRRHVGFEDDVIRNAASYLPARFQHLLPVLAGLLAQARKFPVTTLDYGLLHTDSHHGNFHVDGRRLTLFDFDDCCHHWFAYDLAIPVWHYPIPDRGKDPAHERSVLTHFFQEFIRGYQRENLFQRHWLDQLPVFFRLRDLQLFLFAWKTWDWNNPQQWQHEFQRTRGALIESGRPSIDLNWAELAL